MSDSVRLTTGVSGLDELLGGGLLPGTLTVVVGASGIGKTQLGVQFCNAGLAQEQHRGIIFDMNARVDAQSHADYARRMFSWELSEKRAGEPIDLEHFFAPDRRHGEYLHIFDHSGRRVLQDEAGFDHWLDWQSELSTKLSRTIAFFYGNFVQGVRRCVVDGIEPADRQTDSIQFELFEYVYHQILRKEHDWVARDLFREHYLANAAAVAQHAYDFRQTACMLLYTCHETMLDSLIERPLQSGDLMAGANTLIYLGKIREGKTLHRALYIAKHRGSSCSEEVATYTIDDAGLTIDPA
jgi:KaiC/GvpD/RAD55 family RecA-like ATPase